MVTLVMMMKMVIRRRSLRAVVDIVRGFKNNTIFNQEEDNKNVNHEDNDIMVCIAAMKMTLIIVIWILIRLCMRR